MSYARGPLRALRHWLFVKRSKCAFGATSISYLGHIISAKGVSIDPDKVQAGADWPQPYFARAIHGFLGLAGYYHKFIKEFGAIMAPLIALLKKEGFSWTEMAGATFIALKAAVTTTPILALPDFSQPSIVECDASTNGFGVVLLQGSHPVAFFSRPMAP